MVYLGRLKEKLLPKNANQSLEGEKQTMDRIRVEVQEKLSSGKALDIFIRWIEAQNGDPRVVDRSFNQWQMGGSDIIRTVVPWSRSGIIEHIDVKALGLTLVELGGGRKQKEDLIHLGVGLHFHSELGERGHKGDPLLTIFHKQDQQSYIDKILKAQIEKDIYKIQEADDSRNTGTYQVNRLPLFELIGQEAK